MASSYPAPIGATQVGSYFVQQYYQVLQQQPDYVHQFYTDASSIVRVDGDSNESASALVQIHTLIMSMCFSVIKIKTINSLESWNGGVLVVVSGSVKLKDFNGWRNFVQTFLLAPQEKGYFVLNDVFHFVNEEGSELAQAPVVSQNNLEAQPTSSNPLAEPPAAHDYAIEVEATEYVNSVHIQGNDAVEDYSYPEHDHENLYEVEAEAESESEHDEAEAEDEADVPEETHFGEETAQVRSFEEETSFPNNVAEVMPEPEPAAEEPVAEPSKLSYASILRAPKGKPAPSVRIQPSYTKTATAVPEWQPPVEQSISMPPAVPEASLDLTDEGFSQEGESKSVYVRNLPSTVSSLDILQEFKNFGKIKQDGVFLRNRKDVGICYAFVEFEEVQGVQNAIKASPIQLAGRQVYIEERRPTSNSTSRGGRSGRGRGRGGRSGGRTFGRGSYPDDRVKSNGYRGM
ncbi:nuclear transport factor 2 isoform X1 [Capsicum chacoense]